jgi:hypothetical protein
MFSIVKNRIIIIILTGSTSILHDSESPMNVSHCTDPGCYRRLIYYNGVAFQQIKYLIELSAECHQSIKVNFSLFELK